MKSIILSILTIGCLQIANTQYHYYDAVHNEINQTVIRTFDNGFLIAALEFCYTPEEWTIEGCPIGIHLIKTNEEGDTVWTSEIVNHQLQGFIHLFQNRDGSYSIFTAQASTFTCHEWTIGPDLGLLQVLTYHISETGQLISQSSFPDDCNLNLISSKQLVDTNYVVLAQYSEPFASDTIEGRIYLMDQHGTVLESNTFYNEIFQKGNIVIDTQKQILLFYIDKDSTIRLTTFDPMLNVLSVKTNDQLSHTCLVAEETRAQIELLEDGNLFVMCDNPFGKENNVSFFVFTTDLELISSKEYTIPRGADFAVNDSNEVIVLSEMRNEEDSSDITLTYFTSVGDSLRSLTLRIPENQNPTQLLSLGDNKLAIVGSHNCCNLKLETGPGKTFLYFDELTSSTEDPYLNLLNVSILPNPASDYIQLTWNTEKNPDGSDLEFSIYSLSGTFIKNEKISTGSNVRIADIPEGYYLITIHSEKNVFFRSGLVKLK